MQSSQRSLSSFFSTPNERNEPKKHNVELPQGLVMIENFITEKEEKELLEAVNSQEWNNSLKRRTQHYGFKYSYTDRSVNQDNYLGPLPDFSKFVVDRMEKQNLINERPIQLIVNEYTPGQGIASHTDARVFGDPVISLSLGSHCTFVFQQGSRRVDIFLKPRTLIIMKEESRYDWRHAIPARKSDKNPKTEIVEKRQTRVSLTFRSVPGFSK